MKKTKKSQKKKFQVPRTERAYEAAGNASTDIKTVADDVEQALNELPVPTTSDDLSALPQQLRRRFSKSIDRLYRAAFELQEVSDEADNWLSDNMEKFDR